MKTVEGDINADTRQSVISVGVYEFKVDCWRTYFLCACLI